MMTMKRFALEIGRTQSVARDGAPVTLWVEKGTVALMSGTSAGAEVLRWLAISRQIKLARGPAFVRNHGRGRAIVFASLAPSLAVAHVGPAVMAAVDANMFLARCTLHDQNLGAPSASVQVALGRGAAHEQSSPGCKGFVTIDEVV